jgi:hypothetical protein
MHEDLRVRFTGIAPLLMRAGQLADPLNPHAQALHRFTSKRVKTRADFEAIARIEWRGSLWLRNQVPCVPAEAIEAAMVAGGKGRRAGTLVRAAVIVRETPLLQYAGPADLNELYADPAFVHRCGVRVTNRTTMRTRPQFPIWSLVATLSYLPSLIDGTTLLEIATVAGATVGLGDYRPRFGRFLVEAAG